MNKIATLTFHWATNYGAVIQAYALQQFIFAKGYETEIIDYLPLRSLVIQRIKWILNKKTCEFEKEHHIADFRKKHLVLSKKRYGNNSSLKKGDKYNTIVCGSDQIWNQSFTCRGEGKPTLSYFLNFASEDTRRVAYAVSFGAERVSDEYIKTVSAEVSKFHAISVREITGIQVAEQLGVKAEVTCDPTFLLQREDYEKLFAGVTSDHGRVFSYIIHNNQEDAIRISNYVKDVYGDRNYDYYPQFGIQEWLYRISTSKMVVTNSFHGVALSIIFNTPFIAVLINGSGMNDRIKTVLQQTGLENRCVKVLDQDLVDELCKEEIDWDAVNERVDEMRMKSSDFLLGSLSGT